MIRIILLFACLALTVSSPKIVGQEAQTATEAATPAVSQTASSESLLDLGDVVQQYIAENEAVGAELLVLQKGQILFHESFGFSDRDDERRWENDTLCNIRSMTKPITAVAAQILIDRDLLNLGDPVAKYLDSFDNEESKSISVRQVLTHRSGLPMTNLMNPFQYSSLAQQVAAAGEKGPQFEPGSKFWYSDTGADVVGALVEKVSGEPLHEFVKREIFAPLGMTNTLYGIDATDAKLRLAASAYMKVPKGWMRFWKPGGTPLYPFAWGSQTVYSTTTDYAKFLRMMMNRGRVGDRQLISPAAVGRMLEPVSRTKMMGSDAPSPTGFRDLETYYGHMMVTHHVIGKEKANPVVIGHSGSDGTNAWAWPERDLMILYFTQSRGGMTPLKIEWPIDRLIIHHGEELVEVPRKGTAREKELSRKKIVDQAAKQEKESKEELKETWLGNLDMGVIKPVMQFRIVTTEAGETAAYFDSVTEGRTGFEATWSVDDNTLKFDVSKIKLMFRGTLNDARDTAEGTWSQGGREFPLTLKKQAASLLKSEPADDAPNISVQADAATAPDNFDERLATLDKLLEEERIKNNIPGFAIAIVKDDEVVFSKGYGVSDIETKKPVETDTLFAIGSTTKAFTGALIAMLVDEGKMQWDDPVTKFLPDFKMKANAGDDGDAQITIRDLLSHRTGFNRMGILWASGALTREEVLGQAALAEPYADFREKFLYNNVMYMAAGLCAGQSAKSDWDALIAERIFKPLGMNDSSTTIRIAQDDSRLSLGYLWDKEKKEFVHLPMRSLDSIGPSGSIVSNVNDMAEWVRFQLSNGQLNGQQLLSEQQHAETWKKQMRIAGNVNYGFGWMLRHWNKKLVVEHGGSTDGFNAQVTLLPELNTGYVLLTNVTATPLRQDSINLVFDTLFGEATPKKEIAGKGLEGIDTDSLVGNYVGSFGPYFNQTLKVSMRDGNLTFDVPSQKTFKLIPPDDEGKWYFAKTNKIAIAFNKNGKGDVFSITMYQSGMEPEFIREEIEMEPETPSHETAPLLGKYREEEGNTEVEIVVRKGRLAVSAGERGFSLLPPDENGKWAMRARPDRMQIGFNKNDDGTIKSMTRFQGGKEIEMLRVGLRVGDTSSDENSAVDDLFAKIRESYGSIAKADIAGIRMKGSGNFVHQGAKGTVELIFSNSGQHATRRDFGKLATIVEVFDGKKGFSEANVGRYQELTGRKLKLSELSHPLWFLPLWFPNDWKLDYQDISILGESIVDGQKTIVVSLSGEKVSDRKLYIGAESGLILKEETAWIGDAVGEVPITITYSDYRDVNGILLPFKTVLENQFMGNFVVQFESEELLSELPDDAFVVPR